MDNSKKNNLHFTQNDYSIYSKIGILFQLFHFLEYYSTHKTIMYFLDFFMFLETAFFKNAFVIFL